MLPYTHIFSLAKVQISLPQKNLFPYVKNGKKNVFLRVAMFLLQDVFLSVQTPKTILPKI
ncbi:MAG: hypothetical protein Q4A15_11830 [Prevotellaceae bacterium]|nr:hypothetical protein [Prevotellaceae bacterium]